MKVEIAQIITQIISFLIMLWVLRRFAWKPVLKLLDDRKKKIESDFNEIDEEKKVNEDLKNAYESKIKEIDNYAFASKEKAIEEGKQIAHEILRDAHSKAKEIIVKAQEDLQKEVNKAKVQLKNEVVDIAIQATEKILKKNLDHGKQKELIEDVVEKMELN